MYSGLASDYRTTIETALAILIEDPGSLDLNTSPKSYDEFIQSKITITPLGKIKTIDIKYIQEWPMMVNIEEMLAIVNGQDLTDDDLVTGPKMLTLWIDDDMNGEGPFKESYILEMAKSITILSFGSEEFYGNVTYLTTKRNDPLYESGDDARRHVEAIYSNRKYVKEYGMYIFGKTDISYMYMYIGGRQHRYKAITRLPKRMFDNDRSFLAACDLTMSNILRDNKRMEGMG